MLAPSKLGSASPQPAVFSSPSPPHIRSFDRNATIVLVGSRGAGKRSLGFIAATHLGRRLVTEDHFFQETTGYPRAVFLKMFGSAEFFRRNVEVLRQMLEVNELNCVIECGMASLAKEAQKALRKYSETHPVIYVTRDPDHIRKLLKLGDDEARRFESGDLSHRTCSNYEYYNLYDPTCEATGSETLDDHGSPAFAAKLKDAKQDFTKFIDIITGSGSQSRSHSPFSIAAIPAEQRQYTYALALKPRDILYPYFKLNQIDGGGDAIELVIDTRLFGQMRTISKQVSQIRRILNLPIIFYVSREAVKAGYRDDENYLSLLNLGLRLGVEYLAVDLEVSDDLLLGIVQAKGRTKIIGHHLNASQISGRWADTSQFLKYQRAQSLGCDIVRLVQVAYSQRDNDDCRDFIKRVDALSEPHPLLIAYNIGAVGFSSQVQNKTFTPVSHPILKTNSPQDYEHYITAQEAMLSLFETNVLHPLHYHHVGARISYSLSPAMHHAAYESCGLGHSYENSESPNLNELLRLSRDHNIGGFSISQPFKLQLLDHITTRSHHVRVIGALNVLVPLRAPPSSTGSPSMLEYANQRNHAGPVVGWYGDNTDWIGIINCLRRSISPRNVVQPSRTTGIVIGAGGMARAAIYAMIQLGCRKIFIFNRTIANAEVVAKNFNSWFGGVSGQEEVVKVLKSRSDPWPEGYKPPTMIVSCVPAISVEDRPPADFTMPLQWLTSPTGGVVVEMAYKPVDTLLLQQIRLFRQTTGQAWVTVDGLEVMPEQAVAQFELMTGRRAPRERMKEEIMKRYIEEEGQ